jgi:hypothetical protein
MKSSGAASNYPTSTKPFAEGGPKGEKNFDQCKQDFNEKPCKKFHTGS